MQVISTMGQITDKTAFFFDAPPGSGVSMRGQKLAAPQLFKTKDINFESLGIGGLDKQFDEIFRRAFQSRALPPSLAERMGIVHVKGMLLFGPPGTGRLVTHSLEFERHFTFALNRASLTAEISLLNINGLYQKTSRQMSNLLSRVLTQYRCTQRTVIPGLDCHATSYYN